MLLDALFVVCAIGLWSLMGYPVAARLTTTDSATLALAPIFGLSIFLLTVTLLYRFGLPLNLTLWANAFPAAYGFVVFLRRSSLRRSHFYVFAAGLGLVATLILLPKWLGSPAFAVFQGNHWDHLNYLSYTSAFRHHPYSYFGTLSEVEAIRSGYSAFAATQLHARPSVGLAFGSLVSMFGGETSRWSYAYLAVLQSLMFCSAFFILSFGVRLTPVKSALAALALTSGFYMQYAFDINAWSQLAAMPIGLALLGVLVLALTRSNQTAGLDSAVTSASSDITFGCALALLSSALSYVYPEALSVYGPAYLAAAATSIYAGARGSNAERNVTMIAVAGLGAVTLCIPVWSATFGHLIEQLKFATTTNVDWHHYFQCYLLGDTCRMDFPGSASTVAYVGRGFEIFIRFSLGILGLYFLAPSSALAGPALLGLEIVGSLAVLAMLCASFVGVRSVVQTRENSKPASALLFAGAVSLAVAIILAVTGRYWAASKAVAIVAPLLFILLCIPLAKGASAPAWSRITVWTFVLAHLGFGLVRTAAATAETGVHYKFPPYPSAQDATLKTNYSWDTRGRYAAAKACKLVQINVANPFLDRFAQIFLTDNAVPWFSARPINTYYGEGVTLGRQIRQNSPDCLMTAEFPIDGNFKEIIWLAKDDGLMNFYLGRIQSVDVLGKRLSGASPQGFHNLEQTASDQWRWTNGEAQFSIPSNPHAPAKKLIVSASSLAQMKRTLTLEVVGVGTIQRELKETPFEIEVDLTAVSAQRQILVNLGSESSTVSGDARKLGVAVHQIRLER